VVINLFTFNESLLFAGPSVQKSSKSHDSHYSSRSKNNADDSRLHKNSNSAVLDATDLSKSKTSFSSHSSTNQQANTFLDSYVSKKRSTENTNRQESSSRRSSAPYDYVKNRSKSVSPNQIQTPRSGRFSNSILNIRNRNTAEQRPKTPQLSK
jgi:hypothetical protein